MLSVRLQDDRDRPVRTPLRHLARLVRVPSWVRVEWRSPRGRWRLLRRLARSGPLWVGLLVTILVTILITLLVRDAAVGLGLLVISPVMAPLVATGLLAARGLAGLGGALPGRIRSVFLTDGRCPCCEYDLTALPDDGDGCVTCAECGAAWNWDGIGERGGQEDEIVVIDVGRVDSDG